MKKEIIALFIILLATNTVLAHPYDYHRYHNDLYYHPHYRYSSCSSCAYVIKSDYYQEEQAIKNCNDFKLLVDTTINYYSNGSRRTYNTYSILKKDGTILISGCWDIKHVLYNKKHYFLVKQGSYYKILTTDGQTWAKRNYTFMNEVFPNKILVRVDKKYGIIDINENIIVPIKYKEFKQVNKNLFITKLNGYFGMIDSSNNVILKNEYDNIKPLYDTFAAKKMGKYALIDIEGNIILDCEYDKIKKLGEYIIVKKDKKYGVYSSSGEKISEIKYKKVKLERNQLKVIEDKNWEEL